MHELSVSFYYKYQIIVKNSNMAYAISLFIITAFVVVFLLLKPKLREEYSVRMLNFEDYRQNCELFLRSLKLPEKSGGKLNEGFFIAAAKSSLRIIKRKKNRDLFKNILEFEPQIKAFLKCKFEVLSGLPCIDNEPRVLKIADFCMKSCGYEYVGKNIAFAINQQNSLRTLSFDEILALNSAFLYVLLKKTTFILQDLRVLCKMKSIGDKTSSLNTLKDEKCYTQLKNSKLFMSFMGDSLNYSSEKCVNARNTFITQHENLLSTVFQTKAMIEKTDFSAFYTPLQIFSKYEPFLNASDIEKMSFLKLVKKLSDNENIDEFLFAIRVDNYMNSANFGHINVLRFALFSRQIACVISKNNIAKLAMGLTSSAMMSLLFGADNRQLNGKSVIKNRVFNNTCEPITRFRIINFGIKTQNNKLTVNPHLPQEIESADFVLNHLGTLHKLHIKRGEEKEIYLGKTKITGTSIIKLSDFPLDITYILPKDG